MEKPVHLHLVMLLFICSFYDSGLAFRRLTRCVRMNTSGFLTMSSASAHPLFSPLTDSFCNLDIPVIDMELDGIFDLPHIAPFRNSVALMQSTNGTESEDESESTVL